MCDPTMMMVMTIASGATGAIQQYQMGKAESKIAKNNAIINEWMAQDALDRGQREESLHRMKVKRLKGDQRAAMAAGGREIDSGSAFDVLQDTTFMGELDAFQIRDNAQREAYGYRVGAMNDRAQASISKQAGIGNAIGTLLTTGGRVADQWYTMPSSPMTSPTPRPRPRR